jgi:hypothetical protein
LYLGSACLVLVPPVFLLNTFLAPVSKLRRKASKGDRFISASALPKPRLFGGALSFKLANFHGVPLLWMSAGWDQPYKKRDRV